MLTISTKEMLGGMFDDIETVVEAAGSNVTTVSTVDQIEDPREDVLVISHEDDKLLKGLAEAGWRCFNKDMLTMSILRGVVDTGSDEFLLEVPDSTVQTKPKRKKRKVS